MINREDGTFTVEGQRCAAWVFRPDGAGDTPCVVMGSGFACVKEQGMDRFAERFAVAGMTAVAFDYRHWGASEGEPRQLFDVSDQQADWRAAIAFARSLKRVDAERIAVWGFSAGGGHAQVIAAGEPAISAAVMIGPLQDAARSLVHTGGIAHFARLCAAGVRDVLRSM